MTGAVVGTAVGTVKRPRGVARAPGRPRRQARARGQLRGSAPAERRRGAEAAASYRRRKGRGSGASRGGDCVAGAVPGEEVSRLSLGSGGRWPRVKSVKLGTTNPGMRVDSCFISVLAVSISSHLILHIDISFCTFWLIL